MAESSTAILSALAIVATIATADPHAINQVQTSPFPPGSLTFGAFTSQFHADGTFVIEGSIESVGRLRATSQWRVERDIVEFAGWNMPKGFEFIGHSTPAECDPPGRYRYTIDGSNVLLERVADSCATRRMFLDGSNWRPAGTREKLPERHIVRTVAKPVPAVARAKDTRGSWPSFRGPQASGVADGQALPDRWNSETGEHILWRTPIPGLAHSSPIVWGDRLFVTSAISERGDAMFTQGQDLSGGAPDDRSRQRWMLYALHRRTGKILWERTVHQGEPIDTRNPKSTYASATPATNGEIVVAWFGSHGVHAYTVNGDFLWKVDVGRVNLGATGFPTVEWGPASSPILWNDLVILQIDTQADSWLVALAARTGEVVWKTQRDEVSSWSTPSVVSVATGPELVTNASKYVRGYDPRTGTERWRLRGGGGSVIPVPTPIGSDDLFVFASSGVGGRHPLVIMRPGGRGDLSLEEGETSNASVAWSHPTRGSFLSTPLVYRGILYVLANNGVLDAYYLKTGKEIYRQRLPAIGKGFSASPVAADGKIYLSNEDGEIVVIAAGPEFRHIATNTMGEPLMATPALSGGAMYVRGARSVFAIGATR